jgi:hypothetical protein
MANLLQAPAQPARRAQNPAAMKPKSFHYSRRLVLAASLFQIATEQFPFSPRGPLRAGPAHHPPAMPPALQSWESSRASPPPGATIACIREVSSRRRLRCTMICLCNGIGSCAVAFDGLPVDLTVLSSEIDADCLAVLRHRHPDAHQLGDMRAITRLQLAAHLANSRPDFVFFCACSPCQDLYENSASCTGRAFGKFGDFMRVVKLLTELLSHFETSIPLFFLFENLVRKDRWIPPRESLGSECVVVDAASFGWHHRRRVWLANFSLPPVISQWAKLVSGKREVVLPSVRQSLPDLARIFSDGLFPKFLRGSSSQAFPEGRFPCLTKPLRTSSGAPVALAQPKSLF